MNDFKIGDVVKLKSGSDEMTVSHVIGGEESDSQTDNLLKNVKKFKDGDVACQWFSNQEVKKGFFNKNMLVICENQKT